MQLDDSICLAGAASPPLVQPALHQTRVARLSDIAALRALHEFSMGTLGVRSYSPDEIAGFLATHDTTAPDIVAAGRMFIVEHGTSLIASCGWQPDPKDARTAEIRAVYIHPEWAGKGIASHLIRKSEKQAADQGAVRFRLLSTLSGHHVYRRLGYRDVAVVDRDIGNGAVFRVIEMERPLGAPPRPAGRLAQQHDPRKAS